MCTKLSEYPSIHPDIQSSNQFRQLTSKFDLDLLNSSTILAFKANICVKFFENPAIHSEVRAQACFETRLNDRSLNHLIPV